jgi:hypothetical protein
MTTDEPDPVQDVSKRLSDLYVGLEDLINEGSVGTLLKMLALFRDMRLSWTTLINLWLPCSGYTMCHGRRSLRTSA